MKRRAVPRPLAEPPADQSVGSEEAPRTTKPGQSVENDPPMQGEGNYTAARRYDKAQEAFVKAGKVDEAAQKAKPKGPREAQELAEAEKAGRDKAKR